MKTETLNSIVKAFNAASTDATRYALNHVSLKAKDGCVIVEATDGHMLSSVKVEDADLADQINNRHYLISPDQLSALKVVAKSFKRLSDIPTELVGNDLVIKAFDLSVVIKTEKDLGVSYPKTEPLKPDFSNETTTIIGLNAELLLDLAKALTQHSRKPQIKLTIKDQFSPIKVEIDGSEGLLMPCRVS